MFKIIKKLSMVWLCVLSIQYCMASSADVDPSPYKKKREYLGNLSQKVKNIETKCTSFHNYVTYQMLRLEEFKKSIAPVSGAFVAELKDCMLQTLREQGHSEEFISEKEAAFLQNPQYCIKNLTSTQFDVYESIMELCNFGKMLKPLGTLIDVESFTLSFPDLFPQPQNAKKIIDINQLIKEIKHKAHEKLEKLKAHTTDKITAGIPFLSFKKEDDPIVTPNALSEILQNEIKGTFEAILHLRTSEEEEKAHEDEKKAQKKRDKKRKQKQARKLKESQSQTASSAAAPAGQAPSSSSSFNSSSSSSSSAQHAISSSDEDEEEDAQGQVAGAAPSSSSSFNSSSSSSSSTQHATSSSDEDEEEDAQGQVAGAASSNSSSAAQPSKKAFTKMEEEKAQRQKQLKSQEDLKDLISKTFSPLYNTVDWANWNKALRQNGYSVEQGDNGKKRYINSTTRKKFAIENPHGEGSNKFSLANIGVIRAFCLSQGLVPSGLLPDHMIQPWLKALQTAEDKH